MAISIPTDRDGATTPLALDEASDRSRAAAWTIAVHDAITALFTRLDGGGAFREERWERGGGGGGVSRLMVDGATFEKAGVNRSTVFGLLPVEAQRRLGARAIGDAVHFFASGVSVVVHPRSPRIPTVHLNVRYFELHDPEGRQLDCWFGGGTDLTPTYPDPEDAVTFHRALADTCDAFHPGFHPRFKRWCDEYFVNQHRGGERRGIGGIFYDHLRPGEDPSGADVDLLHRFQVAVGHALHDAYAPIVERRRDTPWGEAERALQLERRGRYVEFNLLHDRGTLFGLQTNARIDSVLMSLPPLACWPAPHTHAPGTLGAELTAMLEPRDWAGRAA